MDSRFVSAHRKKNLHRRERNCLPAFRYIGSLVADTHRTLLYGGIYGSPGDRFDEPNGKLNLLYQIAPLAKIIETAGGVATDGKQPVLDIIPASMKSTSPIFFGSAMDVNELIACMK